MKVFNAAGELVAVLFSGLGLPSLPNSVSVVQGSFDPDFPGALGILRLDGPGTLVTWDGTTAGGQPAKGGSYFVVTETKDSFGKVNTFTSPLTVLRSGVGVNVEVYNSAGELVWSRSLSVTAAGPMQVSGHVLAGDPTGGVKIAYGSGPGDSVVWNGLNGAGSQVAQGSYTVKISQASGSGSKQTYTQGVVVLWDSDGVFGGAAAYPDPAGPADATLTVRFAGLDPGSIAWGEAYNLAGEQVGQLAQGPSGALAWAMRPGTASGIYLLNVTAKNPAGRQKSLRLKVAVIR